MTRPRTRLRDKRGFSGRRPGTVLGRRFALVLVLGLGVVATAAAPASADPATTIVNATVYSSTGVSTDSVSLGALQSEPQCEQYSGQSMRELGRQGWVDVSLPPAGAETGTWSLATILGCLQTPVPPAAAKAITILNGDGTPEAGAGSQLTSADLTPPSDFNDSSEVPVVEDLGSSIQYDRPWRGGSDLDYLDEVLETQPLAFDVFEGGHLGVTVTASQTTVAAGATVDFGATVSPPGQSGLSYRWNFGGGGAPDSTSSAPAATFPTAGTYDVTVQVTDSAGAGGDGAVAITVNPASGAPPGRTGGNPRRGNGVNPKASSPSGPQRSAGVQPGAPAGRRHSNGTTHTVGTGASPSAAHTTTPRGATAPSTSQQQPRARTRVATPTAPRSRLPVRAPRSRATPATSPRMTVSGLLVSDVIPLSAAASPLVHMVPAPSATAPPVREAIHGSMLPILGGIAAVLFLFGIGAARELRWRVAN